MIDLTGFTSTQLAELITQATQVLHQLREQERDDTDTRRTEITQAITDLTALLGEEGATASLESIRGVQAYTDAEITEHPVLAIRLILAGMEVLTDTVLDIAKVVGD